MDESLRNTFDTFLDSIADSYSGREFDKIAEIIKPLMKVINGTCAPLAAPDAGKAGVDVDGIRLTQLYGILGVANHQEAIVALGKLKAALSGNGELFGQDVMAFDNVIWQSSSAEDPWKPATVTKIYHDEHGRELADLKFHHRKDISKAHFTWGLRASIDATGGRDE
jgi:hypothetical protein